jgi:hypothetical protein
VAVSANSVLVYDTRHGNAPLPSITGDISFDPAGMAIDENGLLYVANLPYVSLSSVMVFNTKSANALIGTITGNGMEWSNSIALQ